MYVLFCSVAGWTVVFLANTPARFTQFLPCQKLPFFAYFCTKKPYYTIYIFSHFSRLKRHIKHDNIHYHVFLFKKDGGIFQNWKFFPEKNKRSLSHHQIPLNSHQVSTKFPPNHIKLTRNKPCSSNGLRTFGEIPLWIVGSGRSCC